MEHRNKSVDNKNKDEFLKHTQNFELKTITNYTTYRILQVASSFTIVFLFTIQLLVIHFHVKKKLTTEHNLTLNKITQTSTV